MFQISPLPSDTFAHLFGLSDEELDARGVVVRRAGEGDRFPCRVSLRDARPGERAADHAGADKGDLLAGHGGVSWGLCGRRRV